MAVPVLLATNAQDENFGGVTYHIQGDWFQCCILSWGQYLSSSNITSFCGRTLLSRLESSLWLEYSSGCFAGMPVFMTEAGGPGRIAFSRDGAGHVFGLHLKRGESVEIREHQFLAATSHVDYTFTRVKGAANMLFGGTGFFIDQFTANSNDGIVWVHGYGNVFEVTLQQGEQIDIEPGGWVYKDRSVRMDMRFSA